MKLWLQDNDTEMYSRHNEGKSVVAEKFTKTLKTKFRNISSKNVNIVKLDGIVTINMIMTEKSEKTVPCY